MSQERFIQRFWIKQAFKTYLVETGTPVGEGDLVLMVSGPDSRMEIQMYSSNLNQHVVLGRIVLDGTTH